MSHAFSRSSEEMNGFIFLIISLWVCLFIPFIPFIWLYLEGDIIRLLPGETVVPEIECIQNHCNDPEFCKKHYFPDEIFGDKVNSTSNFAMDM